jgi:hypothetical protein
LIFLRASVVRSFDLNPRKPTQCQLSDNGKIPPNPLN